MGAEWQIRIRRFLLRRRYRRLALAHIEARLPEIQRAVQAYSARLERLARHHNFGFADPYVALRATDGLARPGALRDGVHVQDDSALSDALSRILSAPYPPAGTAAG